MKQGMPYYVINGNEVATTDITQMGGSTLTTNDQILLDILDTLVQQSSNMIGKEVTYLNLITNEDGTSGTETLTGTIQSIIMKDGVPYYIINGQEIATTSITQMGQNNSNDQTLVDILNALQELKELLSKENGGANG